MTAAGDDYHQDASRPERDELDAVEDGRFVRRTNGKAYMFRRLRDDVRCLGEHGIDQRCGRLSAKASLDRVSGAPRASSLEQQVDVEPISPICGNPSGRRMRLLNEAFFFQTREDVPNRRR
jgi:hypothetical protein